jgi:hypothetical protein
MQTERTFWPGAVASSGWWLIALAIVAGCSKTNKPSTAPVTGTVTYKGAPVEGASVMFMPAQAGPKPATGVTDAQGKFKLSTFGEADGAIPGQYKVAITKRTTEYDLGGKTKEQFEEEMKHLEELGKPSPEPKFVDHLPLKYAGEATPESKTVDAKGPNDFTFDLTD